MGLAVVLVIVAYFGALVAAPMLGYRLGKKLSWRNQSCRWFAFSAFFVVLLPVFWDWIPVLWMHSRHCANESGLSVYQTPEQWIAANPGVVATLTANNSKPGGIRGTSYEQLNERIRWEMQRTELPLWNRRMEDRIADVQTGKVLVLLVDFMTGDGGTIASLRDFKVWMKRYSCGVDERRAKFRALRKQFGSLGQKP